MIAMDPIPTKHFEDSIPSPLISVPTSAGALNQNSFVGGLS